MSRFERWLVWSSTVAVTATGLVYAWLKYLLPPPDEFAVVNHPLQPLVLKLHILSAPVLVFALGAIAARHILPQLRAGVRRARRSGLAAVLATGPLVLTGYLVQVVTSLPLLAALGWIHLGLGIAYALAAGAHALTGRVRARQRASSQSFSPWPAKSPRVGGRNMRSTASQRVFEKG